MGLSMYQSTSVKPVAAPSVPSSIGTYKSLGCYKDNNPSRGLTDLWSNSSMTLELCASKAQQANFPIFGVEYGDECWMGKTLASTSTQMAQSTCSMTCPGNASEFCGAGNALQLFNMSMAAGSSMKKKRSAGDVWRKIKLW
jgi:hypothetical protein